VARVVCSDPGGGRRRPPFFCPQRVGPPFSSGVHA